MHWDLPKPSTVIAQESTCRGDCRCPTGRPCLNPLRHISGPVNLFLCQEQTVVRHLLNAEWLVRKLARGHCGMAAGLLARVRRRAQSSIRRYLHLRLQPRSGTQGCAWPCRTCSLQHLIQNSEKLSTSWHVYSTQGLSEAGVGRFPVGKPVSFSLLSGALLEIEEPHFNLLLSTRSSQAARSSREVARALERP